MGYREQRSGNGGMGNRVQGTGIREWGTGTGIREWGTGDREWGTGNRGTGNRDHDQGMGVEVLRDTSELTFFSRGAVLKCSSYKYKTTYAAH